MSDSGESVQRVPLVYIGGTGRGGSTLLSSVLGLLPPLVSVGELRGIWDAFRLNELCGCEAKFRDCPFWVEVGRQAFGGWDCVDLEAAQRADEMFCRHRSLPLLVRPLPIGWRRAALEMHLNRIERIYRAAQNVAGPGAVILDSTKDAPYALLLRKIRAIEMRVIHLVRDSRAVAFSWVRRAPRPEYAHIPELRHTNMDVKRPGRAAIEWDVRHALFTGLAVAGSPTYRVSYEAFVADPGVWASRIASWLGLEAGGRMLDELARSEYESTPLHTIGGNRIRFRRGNVPIRLDQEWVARMSLRERTLVTALTAPLLKLYGYQLRPSRPGG